MGCHLKNIINNTAYIIKSAKCLINNPYCKFSHLHISENINLILWDITTEFIETRECVLSVTPIPVASMALDHKNTFSKARDASTSLLSTPILFIHCNHFMCSLKSMCSYSLPKLSKKGNTFIILNS